MKYKILVFSYDFPHIKSYDMLRIFHKFKLNPIVICSPFSLLKKKSNSKIKFPSIENQKELCERYDFKYYKRKHSDYNFIKKIITKHEINIGLITGARIIKNDIINLFNCGIINYHPGKLPHLRGLDTFYWMIKKKIKPTITVHFIDKSVDLGHKIFIKNVSVYKSDSINRLKKRLYNTQLECHTNICSILKDNKKIKYKKIKFLKKNNYLNDQDKKLIVSKFKIWKSKIIQNEV